MADSNSSTNARTPRFRDAFTRLLPQIRAVKDSELATINVDIPSAVTAVLGAWPEIRTLRKEIVTHLPSFDITQFDSLESYALALGHAQTVYQTATEPPASLIAMGNAAIKLREILLSDVNALIARGLLDAAVLKELKGNNGYKNIAFDLFALSNILKKNWASIQSRTGVKMEELDQAEVTADTLLTSVGERDQAPVVAAEAVRDRQAAYSLLIMAYDEVRAVVGYLRRKQGDVDEIVPSLYAGRVVSKKKTNQEGTETPGASAPAQPAAIPPAVTQATSSSPYIGGATNPLFPAAGSSSKGNSNAKVTDPFL